MHRRSCVRVFWSGSGREKAVELECRIWRRRLRAEFTQHAHETLEAAVHGENLADAGRGRGEICEMGERVEKRERGCRIKRCRRARDNIGDNDDVYRPRRS